MGLLSLFGASSRPTSPSGGFAHASGNISRRELKDLHGKLNDAFGRHKAGEIGDILDANMDRDRAFSSPNASTKELNAMLNQMDKNPYDGIDHKDVEKLRGILGTKL
jgi:hypothetical protein